MKQLATIIGILLLMAIGFVLVGYLSTHDSVEEIEDLNTLALSLGRKVHLVGVAPVEDIVGVASWQNAGHGVAAEEEEAEADSTLEIGPKEIEDVEVPSGPAAGEEVAEMMETADGDTIVRPGAKKELGPVAATRAARVRDLIGTERVALEFPDRYEGDRPSPDLFAYVRLEDGTDLGAWIIERGLARAGSLDHPRQDDYRKLEEVARQAGAGIWAAGDTTEAAEPAYGEPEAPFQEESGS